MNHWKVLFFLLFVFLQTLTGLLKIKLFTLLTNVMCAPELFRQSDKFVEVSLLYFFLTL